MASKIIDDKSCAQCELMFEKSQKSMNCQVCKYWFCLDCSHISVKLYDALDREPITKNLFFNCDGCTRILPKLIEFGMVLNASKQIQVCEEKIDALISSIDQTVTEKVEEAFKQYREREDKKGTATILYNREWAADSRTKKEDDKNSIGPASARPKGPSVASPKTPERIPKPEADTDDIPSTPNYERLPDGRYTFIVFDLETTGFGAADIVQFAAKCGDRTFNEYVLPDKEISSGASEVTGITKEKGKLYKDGRELPSTLIDHCLQQFEHWIHGYVNPVLVAHNCFKFDSYVLTRQILKWRPSLETKIAGFVDTLPLFKETFPGKTSYKQESLLKEEGILYGAHCALEDVKALDILIIRKNVDEDLMLRHSRKTEGVVQYTRKREAKPDIRKSLTPLRGKKVLTDYMVNKIADTGLTLDHLQTAYQNDMETGIRRILTEKVDGKPRVTKKEKIITDLEEYFASLELE